MKDNSIFGIDWDGDGKVEPEDDAMTTMMLDDMDKNSGGGSGGSGSSGGGCGACLLWMLLIPTGAIGLICGIVKLIA